MVISVSATIDRENLFHVFCFHDADTSKQGSVRFIVNGKPAPIWNTLTPLAGDFDEPPVDVSRLPSPPSGDAYSDLPLKGSVYVLSLPPGRYVADWIDPNPYGCVTSKSNRYGRQLGLPFEIKPASALYVGELSLIYVRKTARNFFADPWADRHATLLVRDSSARDLEIARHQQDLGVVETAILHAIP